MSALIREFDSTPTSPALLRRLRDWDDAPAWLEFTERYRGRILGWCREAGLNPEAAEEVLQQVLFRLVVSMKTFCYDPSGSFRSWLRAIVRSEIVNLHRERGRSAIVETMGDRDFEAQDTVDDPEPHPLLEKARRVQDAVKARETEKSWRCFWESDIDGTALAEVAKAVGMSYHAAFMVRKRVRKRLLEEAKRFS